MPRKSAKQSQWDEDIIASVRQYNDWFMKFAPETFDANRKLIQGEVTEALKWTNNLTGISSDVLTNHPEILELLRMVTAPPIARDRLVGLSGVSKTLVNSMEKDHCISKSLAKPNAKSKLDAELTKIVDLIQRLADLDLFPWLGKRSKPTQAEIQRAADVVADRLCGSRSDPIVRNAQEQRQIGVLERWLTERGYTRVSHVPYSALPLGTFAIHLDVPGKHVKEEQNTNLVVDQNTEEEVEIEQLEQLGLISGDEEAVAEEQAEEGELVKIQIDMIIKPRTAQPSDFPLLIEAKSAGDFTNVNKRRKEEATKIRQLRALHGPAIRYVLFLCGYFDAKYLDYEARANIAWVWEHRVDDLIALGV